MKLKTIVTRILLSLSVFGIFAFCSCSEKKAISNKYPNIIVILADDLGYSDLSCFESKHVKTPILDKLAKDGIRFTNFYAGSVVCSPSRASLLTGRNHNRVGVYSWIPDDSPMHLPVEETTIAEVLKNSGYQTSHFGKWHLGTWDKDRSEIYPPLDDYGFDYWYACANNALPSHKNPVNFMLNGKSVGQQTGYSCQLVVDQAINWMDNYYQSEKPFYMQLWFNEPHEIVAAPEEIRTRFLKDGYTEKQADYYGCIENMDNAIGRMLSKLDNLGITEETLIVFTSDNGSYFPGSNGNFKGEKGWVWEGGIRVPAIFYWKGKISPEWDMNTPSGLVDFFPTFCDLTGNKTAKSLATDGISLLSVIEDTSFERGSPVFTFHHHNSMASLRDKDWCLIGYLDTKSPGTSRFSKEHLHYMRTARLEKFELYNLKEDPAQNNNQAKQFPEIVDNMKTEMKKRYSETLSEGPDWFKE